MSELFSKFCMKINLNLCLNVGSDNVKWIIFTSQLSSSLQSGLQVLVLYQEFDLKSLRGEIMQFH